MQTQPQACSAADRADGAYVEGVSCPHCAAESEAGPTGRSLEAALERHKQVKLAASRGGRHLGRDG